MEENKDLNRIKVMLAEKKRTNKWLAEQLGVNAATVSKWCTNSSQPSLDMLSKIAEALKVDYTVHPVITNNLFVYFIRFIQTVADDKTLHNPFIIFSFSEEQNIISRLKRIDNIPYWDVSQIGTEITIDLK